MKNQKSILLLEDNAIESEKVARALKKLEFTNPLHICRNGIEGLDWLAEHEDELPGVILLDLKMPKMDGLEFLEIVKKSEVYKKIPVVILTTSKHEKDRVSSFENHAAGYMVKPVRYSDFVEMLNTIKHYWNTSELSY